MSRLLRIILLTLSILFLLAGLAAAYLFTGVSSAETRVYYTITLADPSSKALDITLTVLPGPTPFLDLFLRDPVQDGRQRITQFYATRNGESLSSWQMLPITRDLLRLWNGFRTDPIIITYQVDPLWFKGPNSPRSFLGSDFAYIRGMVILYEPISLKDLLKPDFDHPGIDSGFAEADVYLPAGWQMVSPYGSGKIATPAENLRNGYFAFGPFAIQDLLMGKTPFLVGVYDGLASDRREALSRQIPILFETMKQATGFSPVTHTCYWSLAILPLEPIHGGASGSGSLVVQDDISEIAHEMFHWWNGATLSTTADANWLKEGFTSYYAAKSLHTSGLWTERDFTVELDRYQSLLWQNTAPRSINLVAASKNLVQNNSQEAYNSVYYGGALLAFQLDQEFKANGGSLDAIWPILYSMGRPVTTQDFLQTLAKVGGDALSKQAGDILYGRSVIDLDRCSTK
jgi:hypothetical protein